MSALHNNGEDGELLSIVMPVHNGAEFIAEAIASIKPVDDMPVEVIVVDDASTDETSEIVLGLASDRRALRYERLSENVGPGMARNRGLEIAQGELIGFLDADDRYAPGGIQRLCAHLREHSHTDVVMGTVQALLPVEDPTSCQQFKLSGERVRIFQLGSVVAHRRVFDRVGQFDPAYRHGEDIDWFFRIQEAQAHIDQVEVLVLHHRRHQRNMTVVERRGALDIASVMQASIRRRQRLAAERGVSLQDIYSINPGRIKAGTANDSQ